MAMKKMIYIAGQNKSQLVHRTKQNSFSAPTVHAVLLDLPSCDESYVGCRSSTKRYPSAEFIEDSDAEAGS
jgi:hypothetical protein